MKLTEIKSEITYNLELTEDELSQILVALWSDGQSGAIGSSYSHTVYNELLDLRGQLSQGQ